MPIFPDKGRGAPSNAAGRFEKINIVYDDDVEIHPKTIFFKDFSKKILSVSDSPDLGHMVSVNPYRGCEHGCIYCYARPTHEYFGLSAGLDFETKIFVKENAPNLLRKELMKPGYKPHAIMLSGVTDCYQPAEKKFRITRQCVEVLSEFKNPFAIISKNHLVTRDIDVFQSMAKLQAMRVHLSVTTLDPKLCGVMEPRTSRPALRLQAIEELSKAGIPVGVNVAPIVPGLTDHEVPEILEAAKKAGATTAHFTVVRLPYSVKDLFQQWLDKHFPDKKNKILNRLKDMRNGKLYDANFETRMTGEGEFSRLVQELFNSQCRKLGLNERSFELTTEHFVRPGTQLTLL